MSRIQDHKELDVYKMAYKISMEIFQLSKNFPAEERFALTDQIRRSSRAVCANIAEAWRKRRYQGSFVHRLNDAEAEAAETQTWINFALDCEYISKEQALELETTYNNILGKLVRMIHNPTPWILKRR